MHPEVATMDARRVEAFSEALRHRGPDDLGFAALTTAGIRHTRRWPPGATEAQAVLVHRRLSILDPSEAGHQPMETPGGRYQLVFNGEVYNFLELRKELEGTGHRFRSGSDTEVLLAGWSEWGTAVLGRLVGMFAFAVLDRERRTLTLARDQFGIKPLYYTVLEGGSFAFASELRPLMGLGRRARANPRRVHQYLREGRLDDGEETFFEGLLQLPAAHTLELSLDRPSKLRVERYWDLELGEPAELPFEEAAAGVRERFVDNVRLHLRSDVPLGAALSGGIDSSAIVAVMREIQGPGADIHTFSYVSDEPRLTEERWIDLASGAAGTHGHKIMARAGDLVAELGALIELQEQPFGSTSIHAQQRVFARARNEGVKVMLDGQGADEILAGYPMYATARAASLLRKGRVVEAWTLLRSVAGRAGAVPLQHVAIAASPAGARRQIGRATRRWRGPDWLNEPWFRSQGCGWVEPLHPEGPDMLRSMLRDTITTTSLPALLRYEDRNSMANSIESRVPFLTPGLVNYVLSLPESYLLAPDGTTKAVFRRAMRGLVPDPILDRRDKIGFATPEPSWLRMLDGWVEEVLGSEAAEAIPALRIEAVRSEWRAIIEGRAPFHSRVWRWINLVEWVRRFNVTFA